jgi:hypothetical protein
MHGSPTKTDVRYEGWGDSRRRPLLISAAALAALCAVTALFRSIGALNLAGYFFWRQDLPLLCLCVSSLFVFGCIPFEHSRPLSHKAAPWIALAAIGVAVIAYAGGSLVFEHYPLSRDEQMSAFAASYLAHGRLGQPIPPSLSPFSDAMMPRFAGRQGDYWISAYRPGYALIEAGVQHVLGDIWLTGPLCLLVGLAALWNAARRLWPERSEARIVATAMALSSTQLLMTGMTVYTMSGHFALDALWLACFLRDDRKGHAAALAISAFALGLHQIGPHLLFVSGMVVWLWTSRRFKLASLYTASILLFALAWRFGYPLALDQILGPPAGDAAVSRGLLRYIQRLQSLDPLTYLVRFIAWQNVLFVPLVVCGWLSVRQNRGSPLNGMAWSSAFALLLLFDQGHGWGYRYLSGFIPNMCLLAAAGWLHLSGAEKEEPTQPLPGWLLGASIAVALLGSLPMASIQARDFSHRYANAYRILSHADTDVVIVDASNASYADDLIRFDEPGRRPLLLDAAKLQPSQVSALCKSRGVFLFDDRQAYQMGLHPIRADSLYQESAARVRRAMDAIGCGADLPLQKN